MPSCKNKGSILTAENRPKAKSNSGNISKTPSVGDGFAAQGVIHSMNYGTKISGRKPRKFRQRKITNAGAGSDAFTSRSNLDKNSAPNSTKGKQSKKEKRKRRWQIFHSKEERAVLKQQDNPMSNNTKSSRKAMRKQKKKREYGLGIPSH